MTENNIEEVDPESESAEFDGACAFALSVGKADVPGSVDHRLVSGDKTYYFSNGVARLLWKVLPGREKKATATWAAT